MQETPVAHWTAVNLLSICKVKPAFENLGQSVNYEEKSYCELCTKAVALFEGWLWSPGPSVIILEHLSDQEPALGWAVWLICCLKWAHSCHISPGCCWNPTSSGSSSRFPHRAGNACSGVVSPPFCPFCSSSKAAAPHHLSMWAMGTWGCAWDHRWQSKSKALGLLWCLKTKLISLQG